VRIYLDVSCLNRPFDGQTQPRIRLESEAVTVILGRVDAGTWESVSSRMAEIEVAAIAEEVRRRRVLLLLPEDRIDLSPPVFERARRLVACGLHAADAVHVAAAEFSGADVFLTCDDRLLRRCGPIAQVLKVRVENPVRWLQEQDDAENPR
jgi:predicted nucleic acid-binding protein